MYEIFKFSIGGRETYTIRNSQNNLIELDAAIYLFQCSHGIGGSKSRDSIHSVKQKAIHIAQFLNFSKKRRIIVSNVDDWIASEFIEEIHGNNKRLTQETAASNLELYFNYLVSSKVCEYIPNFRAGVGAPKDVGLVMSVNYYPREVFNELLKWVPGSSPKVFKRNQLILRCGYEIGFRASESAGGDYGFFTRETVSILKRKYKSNQKILMSIQGKRNKVREIEVPNFLAKDIIEFFYKYCKNFVFETREGGIPNAQFASQIFSKSVKNMLANSSEENLVEELRYLSPRYHALRHSYACNLLWQSLERGEDAITMVRARLGHSEDKTTEIYLGFANWLHDKLRVKKYGKTLSDKGSFN